MSESPLHGISPESGISNTRMACLQCEKSAMLIQIVEKIPLFGDIMLQTLVCEHCGFKWSDVMSLSFGKPMGYEVKIHDEKDFRIKLVRNSSGTVEIPELGLLLEPGPYAEGFFTNIEGLLERVSDVLSVLEKGHSEQVVAAKERRALLKKCQDGKLPFVVRVLDPTGGSALIGSHVKRWELSAEEVKNLKHGITLV